MSKEQPVWSAVPKYVSSPPLPARARGSVNTRGASWSVWDNTVARFLTKPARKEVATTAGRHRNASVIAKDEELSQRNSFHKKEKRQYWNNLHYRPSNDVVLFKSKSSTCLGLIPAAI